MPTPPNNNVPPPLSYSTSRPTSTYRAESELLLLWQFINTIAIPLGLLVAGVGSYFSIANLFKPNLQIWNVRNPIDWFGFILWLTIATALLTLPTYYTIQLLVCRAQLRRGDSTGLHRVLRLCRLAHLFSILLNLGFLFGTTKAIYNSRGPEMFLWIIVLTCTALFSIAIECTRRELRRPLLHSPRS